MSISYFLRQFLTTNFFQRFALQLNCVFFVAIYSVLSLYNRLSLDDFYSVYSINQHGIIGSVIDQYIHWCARSIPVLISLCVVYLSQHLAFVIFLWQITLLLIFVLSVNTLLIQLQTRGWVSLPKKANLIYTSIAVVAIIFFSSPDIGQSWFWTASASTYLLSCALIVYGFSILFKKETSKMDFFVLAVVFFTVGNASEPQAILILFIFSLILIHSFYKKNQIAFSFSRSKIITAFTFCLMGFTLVIFAPGTAQRASVFPDTSTTHSLLLNIKLLLILFGKYYAWRILLIVIAGWMLSGLIEKPYDWKRKNTTQVLFVCFISIVFFQCVITYAVSDLSASRVYFPVTLILLIASVCTGWLWNMRRITKPLLCLCLLFLPLFALYQFSVIPKYSQRWDVRMKKIHLDPDTAILQLEPLPESGCLNSAEISLDSTAFANQHLQSAFKRRHAIVLKHP